MNSPDSNLTDVPAYSLGVDTGGTFTDFVALNVQSGEITSFKVASVPDDPARAVQLGFARLRDQYGIHPSHISRFVFGTTVATNAVIELKGARCALIATRGTRDVIEIQRLWRARLFDLYIQKPPPLIPRRWRYEVDERIGAHGEVVTALTKSECERIASVIEAGEFDAVAICSLFSFLRADHEQALRQAIIARCPHTLVSISSDVSPEFREYERASTTVMNAYVMPKIHNLADRLETLLGEAGYTNSLRIIQSNGGLMSAATARVHPVRTLLSGPAGGVVGAVGVAAAAGVDDVIAMDMGGTSLDVCLVKDGKLALSTEGQVGPYPVQVPQVSVHTIGAGGGSLARVLQGALKVGPDSAGADPGPVSYGRGGTIPTSTDAALVLGYIDPDFFANGEMPLDHGAATRAIEAVIGAPLRLDLARAAISMVRVQVANIVTGIRAVSVEKGWDPRNFQLLPFGGAGSLYAGLVAEDLGIQRIFVPVHPSVLSALGMLLTDVKYTDVTTRLLDNDSASHEMIETIYTQLESGLGDALTQEGLPRSTLRFERICDMRYRGQAYEVGVSARGADEARADADHVSALIGRFHAEHRALYGQSAEAEQVEFVNFRVTVIGTIDKPALEPMVSHGSGTLTTKGIRQAYFIDTGWIETPVYDRAAFVPGIHLTGPALVEENGATVVLYPGHTLDVDRFGNLAISVQLSSTSQEPAC